MRLPQIAFQISSSNAVQYILILIAAGMAVFMLFSGTAVGYEPDTRPIDELDGSGVYQGEELRVDLSSSALNATADRTIYLVRYTDRPSFSVEKTVSIGEKSITSDISTDELQPGEQYTFANSTSQTGAITEGEFSLLDSDFSATWDTEDATGQTNNGVVDISSSRPGDFGLTISAEGMEYEELRALFTDSVTVTEDPDQIPFEKLGYDPADTTAEEVISDDYITVTDWNSGSDELNANFSSLSQKEGLPRPGEYEFEFVVTDTAKTSTSTIEIDERNEDASFDKQLYETAAGDVIETEIELQDTEQAFIQISDGRAFADVVYVEIDDPDKPLELQINTRLLGTNPSIQGLGGAYDAENVDRLVSAYHDGQSLSLDMEGSSPFVGTNGRGSPPEIDGRPIFANDRSRVTYSEYLTQSEFTESQDKTDMLERPLQPTSYQIEVAGMANVGEEGVFDADEGEPNDRIAQSTVVLVEPAISNISVYQLPSGDASSVDNVNKLINSQPPTGNISNGDRIAIRIDITGIFGAIAASGSDQDIDMERINDPFDTTLLTELSELNNGFDLSAEAVQGIGNQEPSTINFNSDSDTTYGVADYSNKSVFLIVDTQSSDAFTNGQPSEQTEFNIEVKYDANKTDKKYTFKNENPAEGAFSTEQENVNFPYLPIGEEHREINSFNVGPPELQYSNVFDNEVHIKQTQTYLEGSTNLRSDTEARLRIVSEKDRSEVVITDLKINNGEFITEVFNGGNFEKGSPVIIKPIVSSKRLDERRGRIVDEFGEYDEIDTQVGDSAETGTTESVVSDTVDDSDSSTSNIRESQDSTKQDKSSIGTIHLIAVALLSFITGTMVGVKIK